MRPTFICTATLALLCGSCLNGQAPAPAKRADPGIMPVRLMDRAEVRVLRVEIQPYAVRSVHTHDDVRFHLFLPVSGTLEITIGSAKPVAALPGQAFFMEKGTPHGFRNTGATPAVAMEVFVKDTATNAKGPLTQQDALALAFAGFAKP